MTTKNLSLLHLTQFSASSSAPLPDSDYPGIAALHGRGSHERDLIGLAEYNTWMEKKTQ